MKVSRMRGGSELTLQSAVLEVGGGKYVDDVWEDLKRGGEQVASSLTSKSQRIVTGVKCTETRAEW